MEERVDETIVLERSLFELRWGSHLYGTQTPTSDLDCVGVFIAPKQYYLGLHVVKQEDLSVYSKDETGKNDSDAVDRKFYELKRFINLSLVGNPNMMEMFFATPENILSCTSLGERLLGSRKLFLGTHARTKFLGYSERQKKMMINKPENMTQAVDAVGWLENAMAAGTVDYRTRSAACVKGLVEAGVAQDNVTHFSIGKTHYCHAMPAGKLLAQLRSRVEQVSSRKDSWTRYGYDTKFGMHLIRLLYEGIELMESGTITFPLKEADLLLGIRQGKWTKEEVLEKATQLEKQLEETPSSLPPKADFHGAEELLIELVAQSLQLNI